MHPLDIEPGDALEVLLVPGPEQIVAAAALIVQQAGGDIKEVQQSQAVGQNPACLEIGMFAKEDVVVGSATTEKQSGAGRVDADIPGHISPAFGDNGLGGHGAHQ